MVDFSFSVCSEHAEINCGCVAPKEKVKFYFHS
jgi:hypothetical protein